MKNDHSLTLLGKCTGTNHAFENVQLNSVVADIISDFQVPSLWDPVRLKQQRTFSGLKWQQRYFKAVFSF